MGFAYQKLLENHQRVARSGFPAQAWVVVQRAAKRAIQHYVGRRRRRLAMRPARNAAWAGLWVRAWKALGPVPARERTWGYDPVGYARNFDDGLWKEDEEFWRGGSFVYRLGNSERLIGF